MANVPTRQDIERMVETREAERIDLELKKEPWRRNDDGKLPLCGTVFLLCSSQ